MRGVNKAIIVGNLGSDPEFRAFPSGGAVANVSIATTDSWTDKQTGERREKTEWHRVVFHNRLAEIAQQYLRKGSKVYVEGRIQTRKWQGQDGQDRYTTEISVNDMQMLDSRGSGDGPYNQGQQGSYGGAPGGGGYGGSQQAPGSQQAAPQGHPPPQGNPGQAPAAAPPADDFDDDIPF